MIYARNEAAERAADPLRPRPDALLAPRAKASDVDVLECPRCGGGRLHLIALIDEAALIDRMLRHPGLPTDLAVARPARAPPLIAATGEALADTYESTARIRSRSSIAIDFAPWASMNSAMFATLGHLTALQPLARQT